MNTLIEDFESILYSERKNLPKASGVYIILDANNVIAYIGCSKNINNRVRTHQRIHQFKLLPSPVKIRYRLLELYEALRLEKELLEKIEYSLKEVKWPVFVASLTKEHRAKLDAIAKDMDRSRGAVLRTLVKREYEKRFG